MENKNAEFYWGTMEWLLDGEPSKLPDISVAKMGLKPKAISEKHFHKNCYELLILEEGNIVLFIDDKAHSLKTGEVHLIPPNTSHYVENIDSSPTKITLVFSSSTRNYTTL